MMDSKRLIGQAKQKFIFFSCLGIALVSIISVVSLNYHNEVVSQQASMQELYNQLGRQLSYVTSISSLSQKFDSTLTPSEYNSLKREFSELILKLEDLNRSFRAWIEKDSFAHTEKIVKIAQENNLKEKMDEYILKSRELVEEGENSYGKLRANIQFLSQNSREGLGNIIKDVSIRVSEMQSNSIRQLNRMGFLLVSLCVLQVLLVWLLVFKPLYSTIMIQHQKISDSLLKAESANRAKTEFLANISHEIRTPMTAILGYTDMLSRDELSDEKREEAINIINQNASQLMELIDEILDISKVEAGKFDFEREKVSLSRLLNEIYSLINVRARDKGINLTFENDGRIPEYIHTDPKRLKQILFNIIGNAIKFTDKGSVRLTISFYQKRNKNFLRILVKDTGRGIDRKHLKRLFRPFEQEDSSVSREFGGTGLGLVLSKGLARGLGGDVRIVETEVGRGTTFEITIDTGEPQTGLVSNFSTNIEEREPAISIESALKGARILVVDDAKENARLFKIYLEKADAEVDVANEGQEAIELAKEKTFDVILLDLQMPGKDGFQVIKELREQSFSKPILALTAHAMVEERVKTKEAGFDDHITKPVSPEDLVKVVRNYIST